MADIRVQFEDGTEHVYQGVPDSVTPEQMQARVTKDFADKSPTHIARENAVSTPAGREGPTAQQIEKSVKKEPVSPHAMQTDKGAYGNQNPIRGMIETGRSMLQGAAGSVVGGLEGLGTLAAGKGVDAAANAVRNRQQKMGYVPESESGKAITEGAAYPFEMASAALGTAGGGIGGALGGEKGRLIGESIGENAIDVAGALSGGAGVLKGAVRGANLPAKLSQGQRALMKSKEAGYAINPMDVNPSITNQVIGNVAGRAGTEAELAIKNAAVDTAKAKEALGIAKDKDLDYANIVTARKDAEAAYTNLKSQDIDLTPDEQFLVSLREVDSELHDAKAAYPELFKDNKLENIRSILANPAQAPSPKVVVQTIQKLRKDASTTMRRSDLSPDELNAAMAMKNTATVLEDFMERKVSDSTTLPPDVVEKFKAAREKFAKSYDIEEILNTETGTIDAAKLARNQGADSKLTGPLKDVVQAHRARQRPAGTKAEGVHAGDTAMGHAVLAGLGGLAGSVAGPGGSAAGAAAGVVLPMATRKALASRLAQKYLTNPSPDVLTQLREIDPKAAAAAVAAANGRQNSQLPPPKDRLTLE